MEMRNTLLNRYPINECRGLLTDVSVAYLTSRLAASIDIKEDLYVEEDYWAVYSVRAIPSSDRASLYLKSVFRDRGQLYE